MAGTISLPYDPPIKEFQAPLTSIYTPVQAGSIRVVKIAGLNHDGVLECSLEVQGFDQEPYTAVSYTWNPDASIWYGHASARLQPLKLNGWVVPIRSKVADILCLMLRQGRKAIWIDGLCIDQENPADKDVQVGQMSSVYQRAHEVISVLSCPTAETDFLLERQHFNKKFVSTQYDRMHRALLTLITNEYWCRTWILQEIVLGQNSSLCCGKRTVTLEELARLIRTLEETDGMGLKLKHYLRALGRMGKNIVIADRNSGATGSGTIFTLAYSLLFLTNKGRTYFHNLSFLDLWNCTGSFNRCSDPKDILYARRGLAIDGAQLIPVLDYSPDRTFEDVYKEFAKRCIAAATQDPLKIVLYGEWDARAAQSTLPSWVPDWRLPVGTWQEDRFKSEQLYKLRWSETSPQVSNDGNKLTVPARILGSIKTEHARLFNRSHPTTELALSLLQQFTSHDLGHVLPNYPAPVVGDVVCILKGCPAVVYLHPVAGARTHQITGKLKMFQELIGSHILRELVLYDSWKAAWEFHNIEKIDVIPEVLMNIV